MFGEKIRGTINLNARTNELIAIRLEFCSKRIGKTGREYYHIDRYMTIPADDSGEIEFWSRLVNEWRKPELRYLRDIEANYY